MFVNATDVKNNFGFYLTVLEKEDVIILRNGKPVARLIPQTSWNDDQHLGEGIAEYGISGEDEDVPDEYDGCSMTYSKFVKMYEKTDKRYEYIDGKVWLMGAPTEEHQRVIGNLYFNIRNCLKGKSCRVYLAPLDVYLGSRSTDRNIVQPDLLVVCNMNNFNEKGRHIGAPGVAIEVLSPSNRRHDLIRKMDLYLRSGVEEYWTIDTANRLINVYRFRDGQIVSQTAFDADVDVCSDYLQDLTFPARQVFE
ncbi:MAG: type II toxin-antitoxin system prevent-host-death family antitoxin [Bacillota bacterium]|nr:type II toxin-antitoxin system prevent-host-death family antitoxin [Bacillota bacterium]